MINSYLVYQSQRAQHQALHAQHDTLLRHSQFLKTQCQAQQSLLQKQETSLALLVSQTEQLSQKMRARQRAKTGDVVQRYLIKK